MGLRATSYVLLFLTVAAVVDDQPYCSLRYRRLCQGKGRHVACQFPVAGPSSTCNNYTEIKFNSEMRHFITHYINRRRQRIAAGNERVWGGAHLPKPEIMMMVSWDRELALLAQRLAEQCQFVHDDCRATVRYPYAGQSVGEVRWRRTSDSEELTAQRAIRRVFDAWWGEKRRVRPAQLTQPFRLAAKGNVWGHFSQLAVWTLRAVGCGAVRHGGTHTRLLLVCDFSHTNMLGERTVSPGPMAPCPTYTARRVRSTYPLLCAPIRRPTLQDEPEEYEGYEDTDGPEDLTTDGFTERAAGSSKTVSRQTLRSPTYRYKAESKRTTRVIDRLEQELDGVRYTTTRLKGRLTKRPHFAEMRYDLENKIADKLHHIGKSMLTQEMEDTTVSELYDIDKVQVPRQKWKKTRFRPDRPGANALLHKNQVARVTEFSVLTSDRRAASLMIDKDDEDQLYRDTGFKANWRDRQQ